MKDRIRQIMETAGLSQKDFSERLGIAPATISGIFTGRTNPTNNIVQAVHGAFPDVSINWLLFGEGEMKIGASVAPVHVPPTSAQDDAQDDFAAGALFAAQPQKATSPIAEGALLDMSMTTETTAPTYQQVVAAPRTTQRQQVVQSVAPVITKNVDKPLRRIKEIRVFYDDGMYETFVPAVK